MIATLTPSSISVLAKIEENGELRTGFTPKSPLCVAYGVASRDLAKDTVRLEIGLSGCLKVRFKSQLDDSGDLVLLLKKTQGKPAPIVSIETIKNEHGMIVTLSCPLGTWTTIVPKKKVEI